MTAPPGVAPKAFSGWALTIIHTCRFDATNHQYGVDLDEYARIQVLRGDLAGAAPSSAAAFPAVGTNASERTLYFWESQAGEIALWRRNLAGASAQARNLQRAVFAKAGRSLAPGRSDLRVRSPSGLQMARRASVDGFAL